MSTVFKIYIPDAHHDEAVLQHLVAHAIDTAGGCTVVTAHGSWYDPDTKEVVAEPVDVVEFIVDEDNAHALCITLNEIVHRLHELGEREVLVARWSYGHCVAFRCTEANQMMVTR